MFVSKGLNQMEDGRKSNGTGWLLPVIGVLLRLVWLEVDGTGSDWSDSICQGHRFFQKATYAPGILGGFISTTEGTD